MKIKIQDIQTIYMDALSEATRNVIQLEKEAKCARDRQQQIAHLVDTLRGRGGATEVDLISGPDGLVLVLDQGSQEIKLP